MVSHSQKFSKIPLHQVFMSPTVGPAVTKTLHSGFIGQGEKVNDFEQALQPQIGRKTILTVNSCTSAIHLALRLSGVEPRSEVISTPVTCTATNVPILATGAKPIWSDVDPWTGNIDPEDVKRKITKKTKAIIAVHWAGNPCDVNELERIAKDHGLKLIFDCAHALGADYHGNPIGSYGDFSCFSFQAIKHLTTGDGGLLSCKDKKDHDRAKLLRWYGIKRPADLTQDIKEWGYKFHMNDVNATIGIENLKKLPEIIKTHKANASYYADHLTRRVYHPDSASWIQTIHADQKNDLKQKLADAGIASGHVHERNDRYTMFKSSRAVLPGVDQFYKTQLNIPVGWWVTKKDRERIARLCA